MAKFIQNKLLTYLFIPILATFLSVPHPNIKININKVLTCYFIHSFSPSSLITLMLLTLLYIYTYIQYPLFNLYICTTCSKLHPSSTA